MPRKTTPVTRNRFGRSHDTTPGRWKPAHEAHLQRLLAWVSTHVDRKYRHTVARQSTGGSSGRHQACSRSSTPRRLTSWRMARPSTSTPRRSFRTWTPAGSHRPTRWRRCGCCYGGRERPSPEPDRRTIRVVTVVILNLSDMEPLSPRSENTYGAAMVVSDVSARRRSANSLAKSRGRTRQCPIRVVMLTLGVSLYAPEQGTAGEAVHAEEAIAALRRQVLVTDRTGEGVE